jgi:hypothetical protein
LSLLFSKPAAMVVSARYLGAVHLRAEAYTGNEEEAKHVAGQLGTFLDIFHRAENAVSTPTSDADAKQFFESLKVEQQGDRAVLTAIVPPGFIRKAVAEPPKAMTLPGAPDRKSAK